MSRLILSEIDLTHSRLSELAKLADQAKPFYDWIVETFRTELDTKATLTEILMSGDEQQLLRGIVRCYQSSNRETPILTDGVGRSYPHSKACYYFFAWLVRDAPQQRLAPLIGRVVKSSGDSLRTVQQTVLAKLIVRYRESVRTFEWEPIREIIIDRLEGSRRSIKGHEKEVISRTALVAAFQAHFTEFGNYGRFSSVQIPEGQVTVAQETFDVSANLLNEQGICVARIFVPIKTRETEGGGHSDLFSRDIRSALNAIRSTSENNFLVTVIVARNWSARQAQLIKGVVDHAIHFDQSPAEFAEFSQEEQRNLNAFIKRVLDGELQPKVTGADKIAELEAGDFEEPK